MGDEVSYGSRLQAEPGEYRDQAGGIRPRGSKQQAPALEISRHSIQKAGQSRLLLASGYRWWRHMWVSHFRIRSILFFFRILKTSLLPFFARSKNLHNEICRGANDIRKCRSDKYLTMIDDDPHVVQTHERKKLFFLRGGRGNLGLRLRSKLWIADHRGRKVRRKLRNRRCNTRRSSSDGAIQYNFRRLLIRDTRPRVPS